ncbi:hypothetical protein BDK51DRAFT_34015 [Blyttiomyces helicus]|uniref:Uncharacterized protein n=1 Tax=Blyttiomyces helicus TaxID=388810 RepID=A0A4P9VYW2_9FUNG|nr:hypothetical protein BDK51DRAFT_34015 [Blyttiomyces helicus]|eukprot:RKO82986.1 hypothetical protein BDK51DRAFT_34015 [Blyttiomyces helicus]
MGDVPSFAKTLIHGGEGDNYCMVFGTRQGAGWDKDPKDREADRVATRAKVKPKSRRLSSLNQDQLPVPEGTGHFIYHHLRQGLGNVMRSGGFGKRRAGSLLERTTLGPNRVMFAREGPLHNWVPPLQGGENPGKKAEDGQQTLHHRNHTDFPIP